MTGCYSECTCHLNCLLCSSRFSLASIRLYACPSTARVESYRKDHLLPWPPVDTSLSPAHTQCLSGISLFWHDTIAAAPCNPLVFRPHLKVAFPNVCYDGHPAGIIDRQMVSDTQPRLHSGKDWASLLWCDVARLHSNRTHRGQLAGHMEGGGDTEGAGSNLL
jgi:hypothetical protein